MSYGQPDLDSASPDFWITGSPLLRFLAVDPHRNEVVDSDRLPRSSLHAADEFSGHPVDAHADEHVHGHARVAEALQLRPQLSPNPVDPHGNQLVRSQPIVAPA